MCLMLKIGDVMNHTVEFTAVSGASEAQGPTLNSAKAMMMTAIEVITDIKLLESIKKEFEESG